MMTTSKEQNQRELIKRKMMLRPRRIGRYTALLMSVLLLAVSITQSAVSRAQRRKKIVLSEFVIEGRVQKPQAFLLLQRQRVDFKGLKMKKSFVPKILKSIGKKPF